MSSLHTLKKPHEQNVYMATLFMLCIHTRGLPVNHPIFSGKYVLDCGKQENANLQVFAGRPFCISVWVLYYCTLWSHTNVLNAATLFLPYATL